MASRWSLKQDENKDNSETNKKSMKNWGTKNACLCNHLTDCIVMSIFLAVWKMFFENFGDFFNSDFLRSKFCVLNCTDMCVQFGHYSK